MRRFLMTIVLTIVVSTPAFAGLIPTVPGPQPPPDETASELLPGDIPSVGASEQLSSDALSALLAALGFLTV